MDEKNDDAMRKREIVKQDGRLLFFYDFDAEMAALHATAEDIPPPAADAAPKEQPHV